MIVIGILGGIACGKSLVAEQFRRLGAEVLSADRLGHQVLEEPEVAQTLRSRWGEEVLGPDQRIDRAAVARIVFGPPPAGPPELRYLEQLTHPRIARRIRRCLDEFARAAEVPAVVLDAPLLLEAGWQQFCDKIVFVETPSEVRLARARQRGWREADFKAREMAQESLDRKRACADWVIDNAGSPEHTFAQVQQFWYCLGLPQRPSSPSFPNCDSGTK